MSKSLSMALTPREWGLIETLFPDAAELGGSARTQFLDRHCSREPGVRAELEAMLTASGDDASFMAQPVCVSAPGFVSQNLAEGVALGPWKILSLIGRGGMGEVYAAERADGQFRMPAAIKVLKRGLDTDALLRRFMRERNILARLTHPNIARLLDAGATPDGRPYFVMEQVQGLAITGYCTSHKSSVGEILRLMRSVCEAVGAAHRNLIVHRDLKASNVLVTETGEVKLLDFGVAKLIDEEEPDQTCTVAESRLLTPSYAAPEQILGEPISTATDVYALGVMLYRLLTGQLPNRREGLPLAVLAPGLRDETVTRPSVALRRAKETSPDETRRRSRELSGDLDLIVLKALHADPQRRYASAHELGDELLRHLEHRPVEARPDSMAYRVGRFVRRYPIPVGAAAIAVFALVIGMAAALWQARVARDEAQRARTAEAEAKKALTTTKAVSDFVTQDLLASVNADQRSTANITLKEMLEIAAAQVDKRFADQPQVAAELHEALAASYSGIDLKDLEHAHLAQAVALYEQHYGPEDRHTLDALWKFGIATKWIGERARSLVIQEEALARATRTLGADDPAVLMMRQEVLNLRGDGGNWLRRIAEHRAMLADLTRALPPDDPQTRVELMLLADDLLAVGEYEEAERRFRELLASFDRAPAHLERARAEVFFARLLVQLGRYAEAESLVARLRADLPKLLPARHWLFEGLDSVAAYLAIEQGRSADVVKLLEDLVQRFRSRYAPEFPRYHEPLALLADAYQRLGRREDALGAWRQGIESTNRPSLRNHPYAAIFRMGLADCLRELGRTAEARSALAAMAPGALSNLPARHPILADLRRVQGLLWLQEGKKSEARAALAESLDVLKVRLGPEHWRTKRARGDLARVK